MDEKKSHVINKVFTDSIDVADEFVGDLKGPGVDGIRRSDSQGHSMASDVVSGKMYESFSGPTVKNEERTCQTCRILISRLNQDGANWSMPECLNDGDVDCHAFAQHDPKSELLIQVTKANQTMWERAAKVQSGISREHEITDAAEDIWRAVSDKIPDPVARKSGIPPAQRAKLVLALEAVDFPVPEPVISKFLEVRSIDTRNLGFKAVWLVGPNESHTYRLA